MPQTNQRPPLAANYDGSRRSAYPAGDMPDLSLGTFTIEGNFGTNDVVRAFSDPLIEATPLGALPSNANGIIFDQPTGYPFTVVNDSERGKVLKNIQDSSNYNSALRFAFPASLPENTWFYASSLGKMYLGYEGSPYTGYNQLKIDRLNVVNEITDNSTCQIKMHTQVQNGASPSTTTLLMNDNDPGWGLANQYGGFDESLTDNEWFMTEFIIFTGTQGGNDGRVIYRILKGGVARLIEDVKNCRIYDDAQRFNFYLLQGYPGNFGPDAAHANDGPQPDVREFSRSSLVVIQGEKRIDLSTSLDTATAAWRYNIPWSLWDGDITAEKYYKGLSAGTHTIYARVIDGYTSDGWDNVIGYDSWVVTR